jgi:PAS domain S-box-containing protein
MTSAKEPSIDELQKRNRELSKRIEDLESKIGRGPSGGASREDLLSAFRQSHPTREGILLSALDCIVTIDARGRILEFNPAAERTFGYPREEALGAAMEERIIPPSLRDAHRAGLKKYLETGEGPVLNKRIEITGMRSDGSEFPVELTITPDYIAGHRVFTAYLRDLSAQKESEETLRRSEIRLREVQKMEAIGRLSGALAHDFNNLLSVILGSSELLGLRPDDVDMVRKRAEEIRSAADRAADLTGRLLALSRNRAPQTELHDVNEVVREGVSMIERLVPETIEVRSRFAEGSLPVRAESGQLNQVLLNLAINARDAMGEGGVLEVETRVVDGDTVEGGRGEGIERGVLISVADSGCGMPPEVRARAFEPFFTTKEVGSGTGLGLATVYGIVRQAGGFVGIESEEGRGTRIQIVLPFADEAPGTLAPSAPEVSGRSPNCADSAGRSVLVVEDEVRLRRLVVEALTDEGYRVCEAGDGAEALRVAEEERDEGREIDLLLTDVVMPKLGGVDLAGELEERGFGLALLFMSAHGDDDRVASLVAEGEAELLRKPFTLKLLMERVADLSSRGGES